MFEINFLHPKISIPWAVKFKNNPFFAASSSRSGGLSRGPKSSQLRPKIQIPPFTIILIRKCVRKKVGFHQLRFTLLLSDAHMNNSFHIVHYSEGLPEIERSMRESQWSMSPLIRCIPDVTFFFCPQAYRSVCVIDFELQVGRQRSGTDSHDP